MASGGRESIPAISSWRASTTAGRRWSGSTGCGTPSPASTTCSTRQHLRCPGVSDRSWRTATSCPSPFAAGASWLTCVARWTGTVLQATVRRCFCEFRGNPLHSSRQWLRRLTARSPPHQFPSRRAGPRRQHRRLRRRSGRPRGSDGPSAWSSGARQARVLACAGSSSRLPSEPSWRPSLRQQAAGPTGSATWTGPRPTLRAASCWARRCCMTS
mmetsp:Transcript_5136/g.15238  ORF Transcript_5136/g.15238 Transcript_5136/m.15238 type:complete len:214 (+) Transcript_5136:768-1409(+)